MSNHQPLKTLDGVGQRLEVYADHVLIQRTDFLATLLPVGFGGQITARFEEIARIDLQEPAVLRLDECPEHCPKLVFTRHDHATFSMAFDWQQRQAAHEMRAYLVGRIGAALTPTAPQKEA